MKIDKGVPTPPTRGYAKYPFSEMEVGDSFMVATLAEQVRACSAANHFGKRRGQKYATRKDGTGYRVWRIA